MNSAENSPFSENAPSGGDSFSNQNEVQERAPSRADPAQISDRSDQDRLHRGGGERPPNITDFPTQEELERHSGLNATRIDARPETSVVHSASPNDETPEIPGPPPSGKENNSQRRDELAEFQTTVNNFRQTGKADLEAVRFAKAILLPQQGLTPEEIEALGPRETMEHFASNPGQVETLISPQTIAPPDESQHRQAEDVSGDLSSLINSEVQRQAVEREALVAATTETAEPPSIQTLSEPEKIDQDPLTTSAHNLVSEITHSGELLGDLRFSEQREHELGQKYRVYTTGDGREILLTPEQEIEYARSFLERQNANPPKERPEGVNPTTPTEQPKANTDSKVQLTSSEMDRLMAESQAGKADELDSKIKEFVDKVKNSDPTEPESEKDKPSHASRIFSVAETARVKVAEVARAVALKTPGGNFVYESAQRYLNNFDWRDKDKVAWAAGIATGFTTNTALNLVLPGAGSLINSVGTTAVTHLLSSGVNSLRLRGIERSIRQNVNNLSEEGLKSIDVRSYRDQYDRASRLLKTSGLTEYQTKMTRISQDLLSRMGYSEKDSFDPIVETLTQELQNKVFKYSKANERIRSFSAGMKVGAITQGITNQFFDIDKFVEHKLNGGPDSPNVGNLETSLPEGLPPLSQDQIDLINRIHQDPEAWKTFTSLTSEQWSDVGRLYEAGRLAEVGIDTNPLIDTLTSADVGNLVDIHQGDTVSTLLQNNGHRVTWTSADADLFGGHILANHQLLAETHNRMVESGLATNNFPTQQEVLALIEHARGGDAGAFHDLQTSLDWIPVNQKLKILSLNDIADITDFFERRASEEIAEELINE